MLQLFLIFSSSLPLLYLFTMPSSDRLMTFSLFNYSYSEISYWMWHMVFMGNLTLHVLRIDMCFVCSYFMFCCNVTCSVLHILIEMIII